MRLPKFRSTWRGKVGFRKYSHETKIFRGILHGNSPRYLYDSHAAITRPISWQGPFRTLQDNAVPRATLTGMIT